MRKIDAQGSYTVGKDFSDSGKEITFDFQYEVYDALAEAIQQLGGEAKVLAMINQTHKEDCRNNASGSAKSENGHSAVRLLTPEEKEARKAKAKEDRAILALLKSKGLTLEDLLKQ